MKRFLRNVSSNLICSETQRVGNITKFRQPILKRLSSLVKQEKGISNMECFTQKKDIFILNESIAIKRTNELFHS